MWRTRPGGGAADSTGNRLPEDSFLGKKLCEACRDNNLVEAQRLLADGASPESGQSSGYSALGLAVNRGHLKMAELLISNRASPDTPICVNDATPMMIAVVWNQTEILRMLLAHGASLSPKGTAGSYRGLTALDVARQRGRSDAALVLTRERAHRRFGRIRRIAPTVALFAAALRELHAIVHFRPGGEGARQARAHFVECTSRLREDTPSQPLPLPPPRGACTTSRKTSPNVTTSANAENVTTSANATTSTETASAPHRSNSNNAMPSTATPEHTPERTPEHTVQKPAKAAPQPESVAEQSRAQPVRHGGKHLAHELLTLREVAGAGRGWFASRDLEPGTQLWQEKAFTVGRNRADLVRRVDAALEKHAAFCRPVADAAEPLDYFDSLWATHASEGEGIVACNYFDNGKYTGAMLFELTSMINHSCCPNASVTMVQSEFGAVYARVTLIR